MITFVLQSNYCSDLSHENNCTISYQLQVSSEDDVKQAIKTAVDECGPLRVSVSTAGIVTIAKTLSEAREVHPLQIFEEITKV